ncbi:hypothetical protein FHR56_001796 [Xanthomonas sacchari]|nr:hypothetical protein [Xanthomonas sp. F10]MXV34064.1 hypothetical protein [Xanthomonas sp. LMG 8989]
MNAKIPCVFSLLLLLTGCNPMNTASENAGTPRAEAGGDPVYQKNPHPTQAFRITMTIEGAPGDFRSVKGAAFYRITNYEQCTPVDPVAGVWSKQREESVPATFQKIDDKTYVSTIYADAMVDADYFGKGTCRWDLLGVGASLKASGAEQETNFSPSVEKVQIMESGAKATYFWKGHYPREDVENFADVGNASVEDFKESARGDLFKVTLSAQKVQP